MLNFLKLLFGSKINYQDLALVMAGGLAGGLLQPVVTQLNPDAANPGWLNYPLAALLGMAAAGISVYVIANSNTEEKARLLFFSLLCGLAFPAVLTNAVDGMSRQTQQVTESVSRAASNSARPRTQTAALQDFQKTIIQNPLTSVDEVGQKAIEASGEVIVRNLAKAAEGKRGGDRINELKQIGLIARSQGYDSTAITAAEELTKLSRSEALDPTRQQEAAKAADAVIGAAASD